MKKIFSFLILLSLAVSVSAETKVACTAERYEKDLFPEFTKQTVEYAITKGWETEKQSLTVDIYEPKGDPATLRPLVILAHGGSFIGGNKDQVAPFCKALVKKGYVAASIQYRLLPLKRVSETDIIFREVIRAINDMKASIRFFRQSVATGNPYKIDSDSIFIGGVSAGAITALHVGILDDKDVITDDLNRLIIEEGGWIGDTGSIENKRFSSKVSGVINLSGSIMDENWVDKDDAPIFSYHGTKDTVVPINFNTIGNFPLYGSEAIKRKADSVGLFNLLIKAPEGGHTNIYTPLFTSYLNEFQKQTNRKMRQIICGNN